MLWLLTGGQVTACVCVGNFVAHAWEGSCGAGTFSSWDWAFCGGSKIYKTNAIY